MERVITIVGLMLLMMCPVLGQTKMNDKVRIKHIKRDFEIASLDEKAWAKAEQVQINHLWSGAEAPVGRRFSAKLLWSDSALYVRFQANQAEAVVVSENPILTRKTRGLWDRDVCEIFLAPNPAEFRRYFEFEVAPTGEWIDLGIHQMPDERITDWEYSSGMVTAARIEKDTVISAFKVKWKAFGRIPQMGDIWLGNILRAVGTEPDRGYLAWRPTMTEKPNFHVPEKFGKFEFVR